jgi:hypothetical protein
MSKSDSETLSVRAAAPAIPGMLEMVALTQIKDTWKFRIRDDNPAHVYDMLQSIREQGLIEPLIIDRNSWLIAGYHRFAAITQLQEGDPTLFKQWFPYGKVSVNRLPFAAKDDPARALAVAISENTKRAALSSETLRSLRELLSKDDRFWDQPGRPPKGKIGLIPYLARALQRSPRQVQRQLSERRGRDQPRHDVVVSKTAPGVSPIQASVEMSPIDLFMLSPVDQAMVALRAITALTKADHRELLGLIRALAPLTKSD